MRGKTKRFSSGTPRGRDYPIRSATMRACKYNTSTKKLPTRDETQWERMHGSFVIHHVFLLIPLGVSVVALYSTQRPSLEQSRLSRYSLWLNGCQLKCFLNYAYRRYRQKKNMFRYFFTELKKWTNFLTLFTNMTLSTLLILAVCRTCVMYELRNEPCSP